jgi:hypothetical protein
MSDAVPSAAAPPSRLDACHAPACGKALARGDAGVCGGCKDARYCDAACQRAHWPAHKAACRAATAAAKAAVGDVAAALAASARAAAPSTGRPLPEDGCVELTGEALGLALMSKQRVEHLRGEIAELRRNRARLPANLLARVEASLRKAPVAEAFLDQAANGAWHRMMGDLRLWHCANFVLNDVPLPWLSELEGAAWMARLGGGYLQQAHAPEGEGALGDSVEFGGRVIVAPAGSELHVRRDGEHQYVEAVCGRRGAGSCLPPRARKDQSSMRSQRGACPARRSTRSLHALKAMSGASERTWLQQARRG